MDLLLCKILDDLKGECICTTRLREIICEVTWLATVVARSIQSCTIHAWDQSCVVFCYSFLLSKGVSDAPFVMEYYSNTNIFIG